MKEIQKVEGEHGMRSNDRRGKPLQTEQMSTVSSDVGGVACAKLDDHLVDTGEIEDGELAFLRGVRTDVSSMVTKL